MGDAAEAAVEGAKTVVRTPRLAAVAALLLVAAAASVGFLTLAGVVLTAVLVGVLVVPAGVALLVKPFFFGGLAAAAEGSEDGDLSYGDVTGALPARWWRSLAGAYAVQAGLLTLVVVGAAVAGWVGGTAFGSVAPGVAAPLTTGIDLLALAAYLGVVVALQFVDVAVVVGGCSWRGALRESVHLTRTAPLQVGGYTVLRWLLVGVCLLPGAVIATIPRYREVFVPLGVVAAAALLPFGVAAAVAAHVAYYRRRAG